MSTNNDSPEAKQIVKRYLQAVLDFHQTRAALSAADREHVAARDREDEARKALDKLLKESPDKSVLDFLA